MRVSVAGESVVPDPVGAIAGNLGRLFAQCSHTVICGSLGGVMKAVCRGVKDAGDTTIGVLPGEDCEDANSCVDIPITAGLGRTGNALVTVNGDAIIVVDGGGGAFSEIGYANVFDRPTTDIRIQRVGSLEGFELCNPPETAAVFVEGTV